MANKINKVVQIYFSFWLSWSKRDNAKIGQEMEKRKKKLFALNTKEEEKTWVSSVSCKFIDPFFMFTIQN